MDDWILSTIEIVMTIGVSTLLVTTFWLGWTVGVAVERRLRGAHVPRCARDTQDTQTHGGDAMKATIPCQELLNALRFAATDTNRTNLNQVVKIETRGDKTLLIATNGHHMIVITTPRHDATTIPDGKGFALRVADGETKKRVIKKGKINSKPQTPPPPPPQQTPKGTSNKK